VSLSLRAVRETSPEKFSKQDIARGFRLRPPDRARGVPTQGLSYFSYGMDEISRGDRRQRWYLPEGAAWTISLMARPAHLDGDIVPAGAVLQQAESALWLLTHLGGLGSKGRKGFGCIAMDDGALPIDQVRTRLAEIRDRAREMRELLGLRQPFEARAAFPGSLDALVSCIELPLPGNTAWYAIDQLGAAVEMFEVAVDRTF
jgi:CRISPR-associated protein Cmr6